MLMLQVKFGLFRFGKMTATVVICEMVCPDANNPLKPLVREMRIPAITSDKKRPPITG